MGPLHFVILSEGVESFYFWELRANAKLRNPNTTLSGRKVTEAEQVNKFLVVAILFCLPCQRAGQTLCPDQIASVTYFLMGFQCLNTIGKACLSTNKHEQIFVLNVSSSSPNPQNVLILLQEDNLSG